MNVVLVESPTKAKTLTKYLGSDYLVAATFGHIRDLPETKLGVEVEKSGKGFKFVPTYVQSKRQSEKGEEIYKLLKTAGKAEGQMVVYLATDPDREGEAIAWHTAELLKKKDKKVNMKRVAFHEITKKAILAAIENPREIDMPLVDAQQARRILDRVVGYKLSPLLWKKIRRGLSAGRVQSVAVRLIVEKEREIEKFVPVEYWDMLITLSRTVELKEKIETKLVELNGEKLKVANQNEAERIEADLRMAEYNVQSVDKKDFKKTPPAPFTTSTLQQNAANKLGWSAKKTMQVAQNLYEEGFITYHRTDSTNVSIEAVSAVSSMIGELYGKSYVLDAPRIYKTKSKVAQEAHEAIRPTDSTIQLLPDGQANRDAQRLYDVIWKRFVACQMSDAVGVNIKVKILGEVNAEKYGLEVKGEVVNFDGWTKLYEVKKSTTKDDISDDDSLEDGQEDEESSKLPEMKTGEILKFIDLVKTQKFTMPPARYNDASLIKTLEEMGIGRPSTYAPTISTILDRQYIEKVDKRFKPTSLGIAVNDFLVTNFGDIIDYGFTAKIEDQLDEIANGEKEWQPVLSDFYGPFEDELAKVTETAERVKVDVEKTGEKCPKCGEGDVIVRIGKFGRFLACSRFPDCDYKANHMIKTGVNCPKCQGDVIVRRTKSGKTFYGCSNYPNCDYASWTKPAVPTTIVEGGNENATDVKPVEA